MIKFVFKYDNEALATLDNVSRFSNKDVWFHFEEAVIHSNKWSLNNTFDDIRERLENENVEIEYNYNPSTSDFEISYIANNDLAELIQARLDNAKE